MVLSSLWSWGAPPSLSMDVFTTPVHRVQKLFEPCTFEVFVEASSQRHNRLLAQSQVPLFFLEDGTWS